MAYQFFEQLSDKKGKLGWQDILSPHIEHAGARMRQYPMVLCLQDAMELDFNGHETAGGLGLLSDEAQRCMSLHPAYVVASDREPPCVTEAHMPAIL